MAIKCINCGRKTARREDDLLTCSVCGYSWTTDHDQENSAYLRLLGRQPVTESEPEPAPRQTLLDDLGIADVIPAPPEVIDPNESEDDPDESPDDDPQGETWGQLAERLLNDKTVMELNAMAEEAGYSWEGRPNKDGKITQLLAAVVLELDSESGEIWVSQ